MQLLLRDRAPPVRVATGAQTSQELCFEMYLLARRGSVQRLWLGVDRHCRRAGEAAANQLLEDLDTGVANAKSFYGEVFPGSYSRAISLGMNIHIKRA